MTNLAKTLLAGSIGVAALSGVNHAQTKLRPVKNIVLVHGAFADGTSWERVIPILEARGFHVVAVQNPLTTLADDANATRRLIALIDGPVILVGQLARNRSWNCGGRRRKPVGYREREALSNREP